MAKMPLFASVMAVKMALVSSAVIDWDITGITPDDLARFRKENVLRPAGANLSQAEADATVYKRGDLEADLPTSGQQDPIWVIMAQRGKATLPHIIRGTSRLHVAKRLGWSTIKAQVLDVGDTPSAMFDPLRQDTGAAQPAEKRAVFERYVNALERVTPKGQPWNRQAALVADGNWRLIDTLLTPSVVAQHNREGDFKKRLNSLYNNITNKMHNLLVVRDAFPDLYPGALASWCGLPLPEGAKPMTEAQITQLADAVRADKKADASVTAGEGPTAQAVADVMRGKAAPTVRVRVTSADLQRVLVSPDRAKLWPKLSDEQFGILLIAGLFADGLMTEAEAINAQGDSLKAITRERDARLGGRKLAAESAANQRKAVAEVRASEVVAGDAAPSKRSK